MKLPPLPCAALLVLKHQNLLGVWTLPSLVALSFSQHMTSVSFSKRWPQHVPGCNKRANEPNEPRRLDDSPCWQKHGASLQQGEIVAMAPRFCVPSAAESAGFDSNPPPIHPVSVCGRVTFLYGVQKQYPQWKCARGEDAKDIEQTSHLLPHGCQ